MVDVLSNAINTIKNNETVGNDWCVVPDTRLVKAVRDVMKTSNYITGYEPFENGSHTMLKVGLSKKINNIGTIRPRYAVRLVDYQRYEERYIPSKDFGILIISTPKGIVTNREAKEKKIGGRLLAYVY